MTEAEIQEWLQENKCPSCGTKGSLTLEMRLRAKPLGTYSLAGMQPKVAAIPWPYLVCSVSDCTFIVAVPKNQEESK